MRIWDERGFIPFELEVLTPVHIGSGEDFSPLEYVLRQPRANEYEVWLIDTTAWLTRSQGDARIAKALDDGDMAKLRDLLNGSDDLASCLLARIRVTSVRLGKDLLQKRSSVDSKAEIMAFTRNPFTHMPYVPASSIKGAMSTAIAYHLNAERKAQGNVSTLESGNYQGTMKEIFGSISDHAMRCLRMADITLPPGTTSIREAIGEDLVPHTVPKTPCEALESSTANAIRAYGNMRFAIENGKPGITLPRHAKLTVADVRKYCNDFYRQRFHDELEKFYSKPHFSETCKALAPIGERIAKLDENGEILLRIGRYSHIECVTAANPPAPKAKTWGTSRTLADHVLPFGWVILKQCSMSEYTKGLEAVDGALRQEVDAAAAAAQQARQQQQEAEERRRQEEDAARQREEQLAAMSPQERAIWELEQPNSTENQASAIYSQLGELGDLQVRAANALMQFWQRINKWEGRKLTDRQKKKVAAVRAILGL